MSADPTLSADSSGVYRTSNDISTLRACAVRAGALWLEVEVVSITDKPGLMSLLARGLGFPATFGANWDALADSLQDLSWRPASGYVLHLRNAHGLRGALGPEWVRLLEVLRTTAEYWARRRKLFLVVIDGAEDLPSWN
jgi:hypothetical protein